MAEEFKLEGLDDIKAKIQQLSERGVRNALNRSLRKGAAVIRDEARSRAQRIDDPDTPAMIHKNITYANMSRRRLRRDGNAAGIRVGVMGGARLKKGDLPLPGGNTTHFGLVEFGNGKTKAQPFLRPAASVKATEAFTAVASATAGELDKEIKKLK